MSDEVNAALAKLDDALAAVAGALEPVVKDDRVTGGGGFRFASYGALQDALRPLLAEHDIAIGPMDAEPLVIGPAEHRDKGFHVVMKVTWLVTRKGVGRTYVTWGEATDNLDRASTQAQTQARKWLLYGLFRLTTVDEKDTTDERDPDHDTSAEVYQHTPQLLMKALEDLTARAGDDEFMLKLGQAIKNYQHLSRWHTALGSAIRTGNYHAVPSDVLAQTLALAQDLGLLIDALNESEAPND